jgi:glutamate N-acetyltransferase/amino-acid acetyltransferase
MELFQGKEAYLNALAKISQLPAGFRCSTTALQFFAREKPSDKPLPMRLALLWLDEATTLCEAAFTRNSFPGIPIILGRERLSQPQAKIRAILINNKISNVCTKRGRERAEHILQVLSELTATPAQELIPCSTGIIGWELPVEEMSAALPALVKGLDSDTSLSVLPVAQAIMTTDTFPKVRTSSFKGGRIVGIAKGAGMIEPNLATMLVYLMTDFNLSRTELKEALQYCIARSFNTISIDSDQSTSDSVFLLSSGKGPKISLQEFKEALLGVCQSLAADIVRNGEGTAHVIRVHLQGARDKETALAAAKAIINSPLVKTAINGNDPNVGRLLSALGDYFGSHNIPINPAEVEIRMGGEVIFADNSFRLDPAKEKRLADYLVRKSVWIIGGDGWAYDIGYGGLDHVLAMGRDVNILVLDTEVYSNTGGQQSKATPLGASAKFAMAGKSTPKKDLGMMAMAYGHAYVARVAFGSKDVQTVKAFIEADSYPGPSIIIAYSHCIAHGYDLAYGLEQQKLAVDSGCWPLYRFDPRRITKGESPLVLDSAPPKVDLAKYINNETRFRVVQQLDPERFKMLLAHAQQEVVARFSVYEHLSKLAMPKSHE